MILAPLPPGAVAAEARSSSLRAAGTMQNPNQLAAVMLPACVGSSSAPRGESRDEDGHNLILF